jgi:hypothetical protein
VFLWILGLALGAAGCAAGETLEDDPGPIGGAGGLGGDGPSGGAAGAGTGATGGSTSTTGGVGPGGAGGTAGTSSGGAGGTAGTSSGGTGAMGGSGPSGGSPGDGGPDPALPDAAGPGGSGGTDSGPEPVSCNGIVGVDCPLGVIVGSVTMTSPDFGGTGGSAFTRACDPGEVLTGFRIRYSTGSSGNIIQLAAECSTVNLVWSAARNGYEVHTTSPRLLAANGGTSGGTVVTDRCPANEVVLGIVTRIVDNEVRRFGFHCGPATVTVPEPASGWVLTVGPAAYSSPERGRSAGAVTTSWPCPSGAVGAVLGGRSGSRIDRVTLGCAPLAVPVPCASGEGECAAEVATVPVTHRQRVSESQSASLTCSSGTIQEFTSMYGAGCGGTCPQPCGPCTLGATSCSVAYNNDNCGDCSAGCNKPGELAITCQ